MPVPSCGPAESIQIISLAAETTVNSSITPSTSLSQPQQGPAPCTLFAVSSFAPYSCCQEHSWGLTAMLAATKQGGEVLLPYGSSFHLLLGTHSLLLWLKTSAFRLFWCLFFVLTLQFSFLAYTKTYCIMDLLPHTF